MMGAVSDIDDYVYDGAGQTGILWQRTRDPALELWTSTAEPGEAISFSTQTICMDGGDPPCGGDFDVHGRTRPINAALAGADTDLDALFHGPGPVLSDRILLNDSGAVDPWVIDIDAFTVPVVGSFTSGIGDQVLLYRPGQESDAMLYIDENGDLGLEPMDYDGYAYPLAGRYRGFGGGGNDILWYDPREESFTIWQWISASHFDYVEGGTSDTANLGLEPGAEYVPLLGDFNGDTKTDIFWYSAGVAADVMWWSGSNQNNVFFEVATTQILDEYQPFVGDFDGNEVTDILWFAPHVEAAQTISKIWYFSENETFISRTLSTHRDYSPYVADFDDDGSSDILWFRPGNLSPIWRGVPGERAFACDPPVAPPPGAYPVGFGGAY